MNNSDADQKTILLNAQVLLLAVFIIVSIFAKDANAQLSDSDCSTKSKDIAVQGVAEFELSKDNKLKNRALYKYQATILALYQGPCSHVSSASEEVFRTKSELQFTSNRCVENGQESDCGSGIILTNNQQSDTKTPIITTQTPTTTEELADDPQVFGGGASLKAIKKN